ncbi:hypothetical protein DACRYDRAFT_120012 [Dacryopinax primogenitus]|uniref:RING-type domain-containing protein n=1 Tax=Dacryopinax primogenitus (strain DJM 731) TaxID=1858805 RepID=M5FYJ1_DACPD|nr:uncharacterized protein DACRYDRAFT_120012 [Dacryopinax primogenitus]EJT96582.1 hypothetical protein DACRYDRAFT_120012 [Dacryopinax primogenitus]
MTRSHSKNNTASSVFSYAEYKKLDYGTKRQRLGVDSMRPFSACSLCLSRARDPVCCSQGHLYCRECVLEDLVAQKKEMKRWEKRVGEWEREEEAERLRARERARERVVREFEMSQVGIGGSKTANPVSDGAEPRGTKRKFDLSSTDVEHMAAEAEAAALKQIEAEQSEARRPKLPDFWLPSLTPDAPVGPLREIKMETMCRAGMPGHRMTLKGLIPVLFTVERVADGNGSGGSTGNGNGEGKSKAEDVYICPSCKKTLGASSQASVVKSCGHVICKTCISELVRPSGQCVVCEGKAGEKGVVMLNREGTGYAAGGRAETSVKGIAFQG